MANNRSTTQQQNNVTISRKELIELAKDNELYEIDYRVLLMLFSVLDGWKMPDAVVPGPVPKDPMNYKHIDVNAIADTLNVKKKDVKKSVKRLHKIGYIEQGDSDTIKNGYRFTF